MTFSLSLPLTCQRRRPELGQPVPREDEAHEPRHVGERAGEHLVHQVVGQVHREQLGLRRERIRVEFFCNGDE